VKTDPHAPELSTIGQILGDGSFALEVERERPEVSEPPFDQSLEFAPFQRPSTYERVCERFWQDLDPSNTQTMLLKSHLWVEYSLNLLLQERMVVLQSYELLRLTFRSRLDLAHALGLIDKEMLAFFKALNRMRNRLAHDLGFQVTAAVQAELISASGPWIRRIANVQSGAEYPSGLRDLVFAMVIALLDRSDTLYAEKGYDRYMSARVHQFLSSTDPEVKA